MKYYAVNFSGGDWSNDSSEAPYYCGVYSSLDKAKNFTIKAMKEEFSNCDCLNEDGDEIDCSNFSYKEMVKLYGSNMDCDYIIKKYEAPLSPILYTLDYRPQGMDHGSLGIFDSVELAKVAAINTMKKEISEKKLDDESLKNKFNDEIGLYNDTFFITEMKVDYDFFHLDWDHNYNIIASHKLYDWYTVIKGYTE